LGLTSPNTAPRKDSYARPVGRAHRRGVTAARRIVRRPPGQSSRFLNWLCWVGVAAFGAAVVWVFLGDIPAAIVLAAGAISGTALITLPPR
jgi:hypothetical protein